MDFDNMKDILEKGQGIIFDGLGESFKVDPTQVVSFDEQQKQEGLRVLTSAFESVNHELENLFSHKYSEAVEEAMKKYNFTNNELYFIKKVKCNKVFFLKRLPSVHFVKLANGTFINAETYVFRLEKGLISLNEKYQEMTNELAVLSEIHSETIKEFQKLTPFELIKLALNKLFRRTNA